MKFYHHVTRDMLVLQTVFNSLITMIYWADFSNNADNLVLDIFDCSGWQRLIPGRRATI